MLSLDPTIIVYRYGMLLATYVFAISWSSNFEYSENAPPHIIALNQNFTEVKICSSDSERDVVADFLDQVEKYENKENCSVGTNHNLGTGVIQQYGINKFKKQAITAVNRANLLTRIWKEADKGVIDSERFFYSQVRSLVEADEYIFAAGNCYDLNSYKNYTRFCPYAYRTENGTILAKDLSFNYEYDVEGNGSEWFTIPKRKASNIWNFNYTLDMWQPRPRRKGADELTLEDWIITTTYDSGHWSLPYFDCGGGNIWMMTYTTPFFGFQNGSFKFKGTSGIDIALRTVDINQCPQQEGEEKNVFAGSSRCRTMTTKCVPIQGKGFRRGSYNCVCKDGYYFPYPGSEHQWFLGTEVEEEYAKKKECLENNYDKFDCKPCAPGCDTCVDDSPCMLSLNWIMRSILLGVSGLIMCCIPILGWFTFHYSDVKVLKAASPVLLRIILLGAFFLYCPLIVGYFNASVVTCILRFWFREIGFSISYGALLLKTWRISVVFRVRSAQRIKISDTDLIKRLLLITFVFAAYLTARTIAGTPRVIEAELLFLLWGVRLCIVVRKAPSEFNESRFISWAIYNETLLSLFLNVSMIFLQDPFPADPDLMYLVIFIHTQLTTTVTLTFLFGSKAYLVYKYRGRSTTDSNSHNTMVSKGSKPTFCAKQSSVNLGSMNAAPHSNNYSYSDRIEDAECESLLEKDIQEEFRRLYTQLETLKQRNMKIGNRHLQHKLSAMTEAAQKDDSPNSVPSTPSVNGKRVVINLDNYKEATTL